MALRSYALSPLGQQNMKKSPPPAPMILPPKAPFSYDVIPTVNLRIADLTRATLLILPMLV
jgi:hypothetical protein